MQVFEGTLILGGFYFPRGTVPPSRVPPGTERAHMGREIKAASCL